MIPNLRPFQRTFLRNALAPGIETAGLSIPRGNGKSALAAHILERALTPTDSLFQQGKEYILCSGSLEQARTVFRFVRAALEPVGGYRFLDSTTQIGITHVRSNTRLRVRSSSGKTMMGLVDVPLLVMDECGSFEAIGGQLMHEAVQGAMGKPGSPLKAVYISTLAPARAGWWHNMIEDGSHGSTYVQSLQGRRDRWDSWPEIRRCNPLANVDANFRRRLLEERNDARTDTRKMAAFLSYRLNLPSADESEMLLSVDDWQRVIGREVPERQGQPIVACDLGGGRAWSAAVAAWQGGRVEALAVAPGVPGLDEQERRDRVPGGTYRALVDRGLLQVADGLRVQPPSQLWAAIRDRWGIPVNVLCDRFRLAELEDAIGTDTTVEPRVSRWSEASADIRALRGYAKDGPFAVPESDRPLVAASLAVTEVKNDDQGNTRIVKSSANTARDDVGAALALVAGAYWRAEHFGIPSGPAHVVIR